MNVMSPRCIYIYIYRFDGKALIKIYQNNLLTSPYLIQPFEFPMFFHQETVSWKSARYKKGRWKGSLRASALDPSNWTHVGVPKAPTQTTNWPWGMTIHCFLMKILVQYYYQLKIETNWKSIHVYISIYIYIIHTLNSIAIGSPNVHWLPCRLSCLHLLVAWDVLPASAICWMLGSRDWNETTQLSKVWSATIYSKFK